METSARERRHPPRVVDADAVRRLPPLFLFVTSAFFTGTFKSYVPVTLTSDRSGIIMETNAKVKMRGVQVGRVSQVGTAKDGAS